MKIPPTSHTRCSLKVFSNLIATYNVGMIINETLTMQNKKQELLSTAIFVGQTEQNEETLYRTLHRCFLPSLTPFGQAVSEEKICLTVANQKQELPLVTIFVGGTGRNEETL